MNEDGDRASTERKSMGVLSRIKNALGGASAENLAAAIENGEDGAVENLPRNRREMIERVIGLGEKRVEDVMAPRADIIAIDVDTPMRDLLAAFAEAGHSRMPVYRGDLDDPIGMVHIKDIVGALAQEDQQPEEIETDAAPLQALRREVLYVPPSMGVTDLLLRMQASRIHMALVIDEFGGTDGLVTIEDLVEEIVGDINDEHDDDESPLVKTHPSGGWEADARVELEAFIEATNVGIPRGADEDEVDTLGGLVFSLAGRVPQRGEVLSHESGLDFEVMEADARKIRKIMIRRRIDGQRPEAAE